jgi:hypothetical protein
MSASLNEDLFSTGGLCYSPVEDEVPKTLVGNLNENNIS